MGNVSDGSNGHQGTGNFHSKAVSGVRSRPSSIHSSPGSSRPCSPQTVSNHFGSNAGNSSKHLSGQQQHQQQQQQQHNQQQRRPLASKATPIGTHSATTTAPSVTSMTSRASQSAATSHRGSVASQQFSARRQNSTTTSSSLPQPSSSSSSSSSAASGFQSGSSRGNPSFTRPQPNPHQVGLPTPGFTSRLASQRPAK